MLFSYLPLWLLSLGDWIIDYYLNGKLKKRYQYWILPQGGLVACRKIAIAPSLAEQKGPVHAHRAIHALHTERGWIEAREEDVLTEKEKSVTSGSLLFRVPTQWGVLFLSQQAFPISGKDTHTSVGYLARTLPRLPASLWRLLERLWTTGTVCRVLRGWWGHDWHQLTRNGQGLAQWWFFKEPALRRTNHSRKHGA